MPAAKGSKAAKKNPQKLFNTDFDDYFTKVYGTEGWAALRTACCAKSGKVALLNTRAKCDLESIMKRPVLDHAASPALASSSSGAPAPAALIPASTVSLTAANLAKISERQQQQQQQQQRQREGGAAAAAAADEKQTQGGAEVVPAALLAHPLLRPPASRSDQKSGAAAAAAGGAVADGQPPAQRQAGAEEFEVVNEDEDDEFVEVDDRNDEDETKKEDTDNNNKKDEDTDAGDKNEDAECEDEDDNADKKKGGGKKVKEPLHIVTLPSGLRYVVKSDGSGSRGFPSMPRDEHTGDPFFYLLDLASVFVVDALRPDSYSKVLDLCAAPGGKSIAIGQLLSSVGELVSNEFDAKRRERLSSVLHLYLGKGGMNQPVQWKMVGRDARTYSNVNYFDRVLVDAPCGSERHLLENNDLGSWSIAQGTEQAKTQLAILLRAFESATARGRIVYSTCSINPVQNDGVVTLALSRTRCNVKVEPYTLPLDYGAVKTEAGGLMLLPHLSRGIGPMYICCFAKMDDSVGAVSAGFDMVDDQDEPQQPNKKMVAVANKNDDDDDVNDDGDEYARNPDGSPMYDQATGERKKKPADTAAARKKALARGQQGAAFWNA